MPTAPKPAGQGGFRSFDESRTEQLKNAGKSFAESVAEERDYEGEADGLRESLHAQMDLVGAILTVVIAGAAAFAGLNVMSNISSTMSLSEGDMFYNASVNLEDGIGTFFSQLPTVFVVIALVLIISYLVILRQR